MQIGGAGKGKWFWWVLHLFVATLFANLIEWVVDLVILVRKGGNFSANIIKSNKSYVYFFFVVMLRILNHIILIFIIIIYINSIKLSESILDIWKKK